MTGTSPDPTIILNDPEIAALGRYVVSRDLRDIGKFRTPSLHNVAKTAPYFHDGSVATLRDAVVSEIYWEQDGTLPVALSHEEVDDIVHFLESLTTISDILPSAELHQR